MTVRVPAIPVRASVLDRRSGLMAREWLEFFNGLRLAQGGDGAITDPGAQADAFSPVGVSGLQAASPAPVGVSMVTNDAAPVALCDCPSEVIPV